MLTINVVTDDRKMQTVLRRLVDMGQDLSPVMRDIGEYLLLSHRLRFDNTESPDGQKWQENSAITPKFGIKKPLHGKTLNLRNGMVYQAQKDSLTFGPSQATRAYAAIHQFGGIIKPKTAKRLLFPTAGGGWRALKQVTIPARPYLGLSETDRRIILRKLTAALDEATKTP